MPLRRALVALVTLALISCLDDGVARRDGGSPRVDAAPPLRCREPWLAGFGFRRTYEVESTEADHISDYSIPLSLPTRALVAGGKLRSDGADLRVTDADGTTLPHWIEGVLPGDATRIWAKTDVTRGVNRLHVYYGSPDASGASSLSFAFLDGIVTNGNLDQGTAPWIAVRPEGGATATLEVHPGSLYVRLVRDGTGVEPAGGFCEAVTFPPGRRYQVLVDLEVLERDAAGVGIWVGGFGGARVASLSDGIGPRRGVATRAIDPGSTLLCVGGWLQPGRAVAARFSNVRVRTFAETEPVASSARAEVPRCEP